MLTVRHHRAGFTLIEMLVAVAAMGLVLIYTLGTFTANRNTYVVIDNVSEAHQNAIGLASIIERDIRNAGYMVPTALAACLADSTNGPDMLFVSDSNAIDEQDLMDATLTGKAQGLYASLSGTMPGSWTGNPAVNLDDVVIDDQATYDTSLLPVGNDSDFREDAGVIFTDLDNPTQTFCGIITDVDPASKSINISLANTAGVPGTGTNWAFVPAHVYRIDSEALFRNDRLMVRNVEDFQLAFFYDAISKNGQIDAGEDFGSGTGGPDLDSVGWNAISDAGLLREIRFDVVVRTADADPNVDLQLGRPQNIENRVYVNPPADGFRRRIHTATIRLRNIST